jgi:hypothetical protein
MSAKLDTLRANINANTLTASEQAALSAALTVISAAFDAPDSVSDSIPASTEEPLARLWFAALYTINAEP